MSRYIGRFAPTPSGPLHFGSLVTALASWLDARAAHGQWLLRVEDIDPPRCPPGADSEIKRQLEAFGLHWDSDVAYQHDRAPAYEQALDRLIAIDIAYPCTCSRKEWQTHAIYPGWCRNGVCAPERSCAYRLRTDTVFNEITWQDRRLGRQSWRFDALGDVVLKRRDGLWAYQLAVVVDDAAQGITDVVRGIDLLDNTPWQRLLQHALGLPEPRYLHLPLIVARNGQKLSKQNLAPPLPHHGKSINTLLHKALIALNQKPPSELRHAPPRLQLESALTHWSTAAIGQSNKRVIPAS
ncbi:tRNA glutamyl-Q(34) synthetase GluQRS [Phytohalomonas tamaricis]|uniref:tRNA glutamyl-Q(34) synthetase GluQRS n=1 Tax=Phytohalomonas tamaricis TaxID=2081032 RepID=UPI000D0B1C96|nr:tRNA glutamyl-Q(34) synthetase GluQRS [Phytohalomonas tamaricis]